MDPEHFGSFFVSSFTLFEAMTFNWVEIARDLMAESGHGMWVHAAHVSEVQCALVRVLSKRGVDGFALHCVINQCYP